MLPSQDTNHNVEALAKLIEQFKYKPFISGLLTSYMASIQDLENVVWSVINSRFLYNATNAQLDLLGKIVGEARAGRTDAQYLPAIYLRIRVNRSQGRAEDIIQIAQLALASLPSDAPSVFYQEGTRMSWELDVNGLDAPTASALTVLLPKAKEQGSRGTLNFSTWAYDGSDGSKGSICLASTTTVQPSIVQGLDDAVSGGLAHYLSSSAGV